ncbi:MULTISPECIES: group 1 truncated hemoglobin [unclassified Acidovorax]|uniref:group I truncated hemoglobin n=1 Tax=unclassified Acidovorax TaxID=2684926 RepID=UPI0028831034|nr:MULTISPECIES: group 1 truncated hemoglobin [unclassified Acidovorax]
MKFSSSLSSSLAAALLTASAAALAQTSPPAAAPTLPIPGGPIAAGVRGPAPAGLYQALGEKEGIARLMDDLVERAVKDPRIGAIFQESFKQTKPQALKDSLTAQICLLAGGPCEYDGVDMKSAHAHMKIDKSHFNALVELLQQAMDARNIPFTQQNRLLALLAPMHRDIITVR